MIVLVVSHTMIGAKRIESCNPGGGDGGEVIIARSTRNVIQRRVVNVCLY